MAPCVKKFSCFKNLLERIERLNPTRCKVLTQRQQKVDLAELGRELKICLARVSPLLEECWAEGPRCEIIPKTARWRDIPMWQIKKNDDPPVLNRIMKVQMKR